MKIICDCGKEMTYDDEHISDITGSVTQAYSCECGVSIQVEEVNNEDGDEMPKGY